MLSLLRKYTIDYFLPPWLNIFHDVTRSVWEWMKDCWRFKCTMLWVLHNPLSKIQRCCQLSSITDTSHILREFLFFTAHSRNMHSAWDCLLLERKSNRICGKTAMHMLIQNCHFHCKYAFMWSGVYQHLNWELEMLTLLLCVTHFFLQKNTHMHVFLCHVLCLKACMLSWTKKYYGREQNV